MKLMMAAARKEAPKHGQQIVIFPEGTRQLPGHAHRHEAGRDLDVP